MRNFKTVLPFLLLLVLLLSVAGLAACGNDFVGVMPIVKDDSDDSGDLPDRFYIESVLIKEDRDFYRINASYPRIKGFPGADGLSETIDENIHKSIQYILDDLAELEAEGEVPYLNSSFTSSYGYFENENLVSLWIDSDLYMGGAHGMYWIDTYIFNSESGTVYKFLDLFDHESGVVYIMDTIFDELESNADYYFDSAVETVWAYDYDFKYYIDGEILTIYFPLYDIAPYASGIISFEFTCYELEDGLKPEVFSAMEGQLPTENLF